MITIMSDAISELFRSAWGGSASRGTVLFHVDDPVREVYLVTCGSLTLRRLTEAGGEMILQTAVPGDVLAEASIYSARYHCEGVALGDCTYQVVPRSEFCALLEQDGLLAAAWARRLARGMQAARSKAEIRGLRRVAERLDMWLVLNGPLPDRGTWHLLAAELGVSREALYREMARR
ncbi:MAG: cAMP-binding protein [Rhodobacteraceae bacterium]|nr:MAG: cAMP-binding protein [Paracoccaceae bacterium]